MKSSLLISIIVITLNDQDGLKKTLKSINDQSYKNYQIIIKDGGSNYDIKQVIDNILIQNYFFDNSPDTGIYNAMNQALKYAKGHWIIFLNSGDLLYNNQILKKIFQDNYTKIRDYEIIYGDCLLDYHFTKYHMKAGKLKELKYFSQFSHQSCFFRSDLVIHYKESYKLIADFVLIQKFFFSGKKFIFLPEIISINDPFGVSSKKRFQLINEYLLLAKENSFNCSVIYLAKFKLFFSVVFEYLFGLKNTIKIKKIIRNS